MNLTDLLADFEQTADNTTASGSRPKASAPDPATMRAMAPMPHGNPAPISEDDLRVMMAEARRDVRRQSGLVGQVMTRLRGDEVQRRNYASLLRRIDSWDAAEEAKLAVFLVISLKVLGFQMALSGLDEMEKYLAGYAPGSAAARAGQEMLEGQIRDLPNLVEQVTLRANRGVLKPFGLDR